MTREEKQQIIPAGYREHILAYFELDSLAQAFEDYSYCIANKTELGWCYYKRGYIFSRYRDYDLARKDWQGVAATVTAVASNLSARIRCLTPRSGSSMWLIAGAIRFLFHRSAQLLSITR